MRDLESDVSIKGPKLLGLPSTRKFRTVSNLPKGSNAYYFITHTALMNKTEPTTRQIGNHLEVFIYTAPKKNHAALAENLKKFLPWFEKNGVRIDYYQFRSSYNMEGMESIAKTLSVAKDEDIWIELQYFRDYNHCQIVYAKMMQDKSLKPLGDEFFGLVTQGKNLVTGGFGRFKQ